MRATCDVGLTFYNYVLILLFIFLNYLLYLFLIQLKMAKLSKRPVLLLYRWQ